MLSFGLIMFRLKLRLLAVVFVALVCAVPQVRAEPELVTVAVAANFLEPMRRIAAAYTETSGVGVRIVSGSTGGLYAKIRNGAPYDLFLAADRATPHRLDSDGLAMPGTRFTYAVGRLALWTKSRALAATVGPEILRRGAFNHIALANPTLAPYGAAAIQTLRALGLEQSLRSKFVRGQSIGQAYQFVATGSAPLGFVALSQLRRPNREPGGAWWLVPERLHDPIEQDAVAVAGRPNPAVSKAVLRFLRSDRGRAIIQTFGYGVAPTLVNQ
jgi:molybdate transport system substrate-binding protein